MLVNGIINNLIDLNISSAIGLFKVQWRIRFVQLTANSGDKNGLLMMTLG